MERIVDRGITVLIPPDASKRKGARAGWDGGLYAFLRASWPANAGGEHYRQRQPMIEPLFGQTSTIAASIAFNEEAGPPSARNGA